MASDRLSPFWTLQSLRSIRRPSTQLSPEPESEGSAPPSIKSNNSRGRKSFRGMIKRIRSSSNITLSDQPSVKPADFKEIESWYTGFQRYNILLTTRFSTNDPALTEDLSKVCNILSKNCGGQFIHGLPEAVFDFALLWCPAEPSKRKDLTQPTWSWLGWEGRINFPFDPTSCPNISSTPESRTETFKSEILHYHIGPATTPYTIRREKKSPQLRIQYPPYFHAPRGHDANILSDTLRFSAQTISADGFTAEQLHYEDKEIPCCQLINSKDQLCGVIMDFEESISEPSSSGPYEFVLLSRNKRNEAASQPRARGAPTMHPPGTPIWHGERFSWSQEIVDYDEEVFESGPWMMLNVMLVRWVGGHAERVAVARIHEKVWMDCDPVKKDIILK